MAKLYNQDYGKIVRNTPPIYIQTVIDWLKLNPHDTVLEVGCNRGEVVAKLSEITPNVYGVDINQEIIENSHNSRLAVADAASLPFEDNKFTKTFSIHVLEHIPNLKLAMSELDRVTANGGLSFHAFPSNLIRGLDGAFWDGWAITKNPIKALQIARQLHVHKINPKILQGFINGTNWKLVKSRRVFVKEEMGPSWMVLLQKA